MDFTTDQIRIITLAIEHLSKIIKFDKFNLDYLINHLESAMVLFKYIPGVYICHTLSHHWPIL